MGSCPNYPNRNKSLQFFQSNQFQLSHTRIVAHQVSESPIIVPLLAQVPLPFPSPFDNVDLKIIDEFHLRKHVREECHTKYNLATLKKAYPNYNTSASEQTFAWLRRFKRIVCSMPKIHNHFFIHRMVSRHNLYTTVCYMRGKKPPLPNIKHFTQE